jgi:hypothetical protein
MLQTTRRLCALTAIAAVFSLPAGHALAQEADAHVFDTTLGTMSRAQVLADLTEARLTGTLASTGEAGDSDAVLLARADFNQRQTRVLLARQQADQIAAAQPSPAMREAEMLMAEAMAEADLALEWLALLEDDPVLIGMAIEIEDPASKVPTDGQPLPNDAPATPAAPQAMALPERRD